MNPDLYTPKINSQNDRGTGSTLQRLWVLLALHSGWGLNSQQEKTVSSYPHL